MSSQRRFAFALAAACSASCDGRAPEPRTGSAESCDAPAVRQVVTQLGERMRRVSLLAPDSVRAREIREGYAPLVTPSLLQSWLADPADAPGRKVSSPWPERIEIRSVESEDSGTCRVEGEVVYATSAEPGQLAATPREPVTLAVRLNGGWRISGYERVAPPAIDHTAQPTPPSR